MKQKEEIKKQKKKQLNVILLHFNLESVCEEDEDEDDYKPAAVVTLMFVTFADGQRAAPLSIKSALSPSAAAEDVTSVAGEVDNIIEVELAAVGSPVAWVARVAARDGCRRGDTLNWWLICKKNEQKKE